MSVFCLSSALCPLTGVPSVYMGHWRLLCLNTKDEILAQLRARRPFKEIRTEVHSISKLYEAGGQYLDELEVDLETRREENLKLEEERSCLEAQVENLRVEVEGRSEENQKLEQETGRLSDEISEKAMELDNLQERIDGFQERGFTPEIMNKLESMVDRGGDTLLKQVESVDKYHEAMKNFSRIKKYEGHLVRKIRALEKKEKQTQDSLDSLKNRIDDMKLQAMSIKDAVDVVILLLNRGYRVEDVKAVAYGLEFIGIEDDPDLSISRLVAGLKKQKGQAILTKKVTRKRQELNELEKAFEDTKMRSRIAEEETLKSIQEVENSSIQAIQSTTEVANQVLTATCEKFDNRAQASLQDFGVRAEDKIKWIEEQNRQRIEFEHQKVLSERDIRYGKFLQSILESDKFLSTVDLQWVLTLSQRIRLWIRTNLPYETVFPSDSVCQRQFGLSRYQPYNASVLAELVVAALEAESLRQQTDHAKRQEMT